MSGVIDRTRARVQQSDTNPENYYSDYRPTPSPLQVSIAILASFVSFLLPPRCLGEGWGGVKNLRLLQGLLYNQLKLSAFICLLSAIETTYDLRS
ncbi:hypothetical protein QUA79_04710 [Microcoleus sp. F8-D1]